MKKLTFTIMVLFFGLLGCSKDTIFQKNFQLDSDDKYNINSFMNRHNNHFLYESTLDSFVLPNEEQLIQEGSLRDIKKYQKSLEITSKWITNKLSADEKKILSDNCSRVIQQINAFPLNEVTLACAPWWIEKKHDNLLNASMMQKNIFSDESGDENNLDFKSKTKKPVLVNLLSILDLEESLPNLNAFKKIKDTYQGMNDILSEKNIESNAIHSRMGILFLIYNEKKNAQRAFDKILKSEIISIERARALFWLGEIENQNNNKNSKKINKYWKEILTNYPASLYAIIIAQKLDLSLQDFFISDREVKVTSRIVGGWNEENLLSFLSELLFINHQTEAAKKLYVYMENLSHEVDPSMYLSWAMIQNKMANFHGSISILERYVNKVPKFQMSEKFVDLFFPRPYLEEVLFESGKGNMSSILTLSLMRQESSFNRYAISSQGAYGLMQVLIPTARSVASSHVTGEQLFDARFNIQIGQKYLFQLLTKYPARLELVLAAYNAGPGRVDPWVKRIPTNDSMLFLEYIPYYVTRSYTSKIIRNCFWYKYILSKNLTSSGQTNLCRTGNDVLGCFNSLCQ